MIPNIKNENDLRRLAGIPIKEAPIDIPPDDDDEAEDWGVPSKPSGSIDNIIAKHREAFESVMRGESSLYDHDEFYDELYEHHEDDLKEVRKEMSQLALSMPEKYVSKQDLDKLTSFINERFNKLEQKLDQLKS